jgi:hypothetical protein
VWREYGAVVGHGPGGSRKIFCTSRGPLVSGGPTLKPPKIKPMFGGCVRNFRQTKKTAENYYDGRKTPAFL